MQLCYQFPLLDAIGKCCHFYDSNQKKLSDREQAIYNLICENKHLTVEQVMAEFDISRATVFRDYAKIKKITGAVYDKNESVWKL